MQTRRVPAAAAVGFLVLSAAAAGTLARQAERVPADADDIAGLVTGARGPEAGVWVIAETRDTPTPLIKIVVTDDRGRYLVPDLPKANYTVWVRGYGLVDSMKVQAAPGKALNLTAVVAPNAAAAAEVYPAYAWYALLQPPAKSEFPGTGPNGNGIPESMRSQGGYLSDLTINGCVVCHQMGNKVTREMPKNMGTFPTTVAA